MPPGPVQRCPKQGHHAYLPVPTAEGHDRRHNAWVQTAPDANITDCSVVGVYDLHEDDGLCDKVRPGNFRSKKADLDSVLHKLGPKILTA